LNKDTYSKIIEAINIYNKYRMREAEAELIDINNSEVIIRFTGSFCYTCGVRDWIEDLKYILLDLGIENELINVIEESDNSRIGVFRLIHKGEHT